MRESSSAAGLWSILVGAVKKKRPKKFIHTIFVALRPQGFHTLCQGLFLAAFTWLYKIQSSSLLFLLLPFECHFESRLHKTPSLDGQLDSPNTKLKYRDQLFLGLSRLYSHKKQVTNFSSKYKSFKKLFAWSQISRTFPMRFSFNADLKCVFYNMRLCERSELHFFPKRYLNFRAKNHH